MNIDKNQFKEAILKRYSQDLNSSPAQIIDEILELLDRFPTSEGPLVYYLVHENLSYRCHHEPQGNYPYTEIEFKIEEVLCNDIYEFAVSLNSIYDLKNRLDEEYVFKTRDKAVSYIEDRGRQLGIEGQRGVILST